jgi:hypothetical protein
MIPEDVSGPKMKAGPQMMEQTQHFLITLMPFSIRERGITTLRMVYKTSLMAMMNMKLRTLTKTSTGLNHICLIYIKLPMPSNTYPILLLSTPLPMLIHVPHSQLLMP